MTYQPNDILFNKYRIEELIGRGAFAEVYRATHIEMNVPRALKVLRKDAPGLGSTLYGDYEQRFRQEVQLGARINHPNVIQVYDADRHDDDLILVMEYAPGGSLADRIQEYRDTGKILEIEEALQIAADIAAGLGELHNLDAVHRDIKPSNILFDARGRAKVADFGLAQIPGGPSMRSQLSQPTPHPGTPGYMSPEQESTGHYLRPSSDVYALGLVLFEMLTGRNYHHIEPGTQPGDLRYGLSDWMDELIALLLAEDPRDRPWDGKKAASLLDEGMRKIAAGQYEPEQLDKAQVEAERRTRRTPLLTHFKKRVSNVPRRVWGIAGAIMLGIVIAFMANWLVSNGMMQLAKPTPTDTREASTTPTKLFTPMPSPSKTQIASLTPTSTVSATLTNTPTFTPSATPSPSLSPTESGCQGIDISGYWEANSSISWSNVRWDELMEYARTAVYQYEFLQNGCLISGSVWTEEFVDQPDGHWDDYYNNDYYEFNDRQISDGWFNDTKSDIQIIDINTLYTYWQDHLIIIKRRDITPTPLPLDSKAIPDVVGLEMAEARSVLEEQGFEVAEIAREDPETILGRVVEQDPLAGEMLSVGETVQLYISGEYINRGTFSQTVHDEGCWNHKFKAAFGTWYQLFWSSVGSSAVYTRTIIQPDDTSQEFSNVYYSNYTGEVVINVCVEKRYSNWSISSDYSIDVYEVKFSP